MLGLNVPQSSKRGPGNKLQNITNIERRESFKEGRTCYINYISGDK